MSATTIIQLAIAGSIVYYITSLNDNKVDVDITPTQKPEPEPPKPTRKSFFDGPLPVKLDEKNNPFNKIKWDFSNIHPPVFDGQLKKHHDFSILPVKIKYAKM